MFVFEAHYNNIIASPGHYFCIGYDLSKMECAAFLKCHRDLQRNNDLYGQQGVQSESSNTRLCDGVHELTHHYSNQTCTLDESSQGPPKSHGILGCMSS